ncbi:class I SAM-dependent methyltransferase [Azospirillum sp.]|uniref:class I SAM-dependent methyltransferase n=1 Tax=Azospirillum sp. TaxID=34012 RepID=UPI002D2C4E5E|nr:class I SAM-dependent methyltransferase [Azospirillum sp.]HYD64516.1 class I SAM-dependent methyltransferase [Azospirillum sp.]
MAGFLVTAWRNTFGEGRGETLADLTAARGFADNMADGAIDGVACAHGLDGLDADAVTAALAEFRRVARRGLMLKAGGHDRRWWEACAFAAGWRKHPLYLGVTPYHALEREAPPFTLALERIPDAALAAYPLARLAAERDLHMDMLREPGRRADAHVVRYELAAELVEPGARVLDVACGLGYGSALLARRTAAARVVGMDASGWAVDYATLNYAALDERLSYRAGDACDLSAFADGAFDLVVSFETIEHLPDYRPFLAEVARVLKPGGRLIASVPNLWIDETGTDPNPWHFHVFDWPRFEALFGGTLALERRFSQRAGGGMRDPGAARELAEVQGDGPADSEWCLGVVVKAGGAAASRDRRTQAVWAGRGVDPRAVRAERERLEAEIGGMRLRQLALRGAALLAAGQRERADACFAAAEARDARWGAWFVAQALLGQGLLAEGWAWFARRFPSPVESLTGQRVRVTGGPGLGDELMFASCLPDLIAAGARVVVEGDPRLAPLYARSFPLAEAGAADAEVAMAALPRLFRPDLSRFPAAGGYLKADPARVAFWRGRLAELGDGPKVGLSWRGRRGSGSLETWRPVLDVPGVRVVSLQYDPDPAEAVHSWHDLDLTNDLDGVAALMSALDLVVTAPTAVGDLAGAVGVPVWRAGWDDDWAMLGTGRRPWYPSMRLFTVPPGEPLDGAVRAMAAGLRVLHHFSG